MRKLLFALILCFMLLITGIVIVKGVDKGAIEIWGIKTIMLENDNLDEENDKLTKLVKDNYATSLAGLDQTAESMQRSKTTYEEKAVLLSKSDFYLQTEEYEIEFLWTKIGNYARDEGVVLKMDVAKSQLEGRYDLNFNATGKYSDVTQLIYDIENDSKLGFKIEKFKMTSTESGVEASFTCKEIRIKIDESKMQSGSQQSDGSQLDSNGENGENGENAGNESNGSTGTTTDATASSSTGTSTNASSGNNNSQDTTNAANPSSGTGSSSDGSGASSTGNAGDTTSSPSAPEQ